MRTKDEIERSLAEMKKMADDALRGLAKAQEMNATVLARHFEQWHTRSEARVQILSWVLGEQELNKGIKPQLPQATVSSSLPHDAQELLDEAIADVITISTLNEQSVAKKLISEQFLVIDKDYLGGYDC